ncbi:hypothetical protein [Psychroserpens sp. Hel_I_66]|uniref:hypothetical protein n=1 Tax=Psychroserpens sp. Hel_I_66 TaxID=1250004 RepID=UPI0012E03E95|nr:hypothetical protein [Psychroserpens sp. Hel_I_66]
MKKTTFLTALLFLSFLANSQVYVAYNHGDLKEDSQGRFIGDLKVSDIMNRATLDAADDKKFLKEFTLKMKVWDYLGEPMEMYAFQWTRKKSYTVKVDNEIRSMSLEKLKEYPDLQKRFLDIRPTKVDIKIAGVAGDGNTTNTYKVGQVNIPEENIPVVMMFDYIVKDVDLLIAKEGEYREPTIAGSPPTWNEFFNWSYSDPSIGPDIKLNVSEASFNRLTESEQNQRIKKIKNVWKQIKHMKLRADLKTLEWPELEMIDIIKTYDRYKNNKKELSPREKIDAELAKLQRITEYTSNDEWGELPELVEPELIVKDSKLIKYLNTNIVLFEVHNKQTIYPLAYDYDKERDNDGIDRILQTVPYFIYNTMEGANGNTTYLIDVNGNKKINIKFDNIYYYNSASKVLEYHLAYIKKGDDLFNFKSVSWSKGKVRKNTFLFDRNGEYIIAKRVDKDTKMIRGEKRANVSYITTYIYDMNFNLIESFKGVAFR